MSTIVGEYLHLVDRIAASIALPSIRSLHLPPDAATGKNAEFCALELADGSLGLSYLWLGYERPHLRDSLSRTSPAASACTHSLAGTGTATRPGAPWDSRR